MQQNSSYPNTWENNSETDKFHFLSAFIAVHCVIRHNEVSAELCHIMAGRKIMLR